MQQILLLRNYKKQRDKERFSVFLFITILGRRDFEAVDEYDDK